MSESQPRGSVGGATDERAEATRFLVAVDESEASARALDYVGAVLGPRPDARVCLLHVVGPLPAELAGGDRPSSEERDAQAAWMLRAREDGLPCLERATSVLRDAGLAAAAIERRSVDAPSGDLAAAILDAARAARCATVVVGRDSITWAPQLLHRHVGEGVVRGGRGLAVWLVG